jgi:hypothetical protein
MPDQLVSSKNLRQKSSMCDLDSIIEDRNKDGIFKRLAKLQALGAPNIIVVGQRFLQDTPEVGVLSSNASKEGLVQHWMNEEQVVEFVR